MDNWDFEVESKPRKRKFIRFKDIILYEDEQVIVVNKPSGVSSLADRGDEDTNLLKWGRNYFEGLKICHRLDKMTTGVLLFAKDLETYKFINRQFEQREVIKHYVALVQGVRKFEEFVIDAPLSLSGTGKARIDYHGGKESVTVVDTAETFRDFTLVDCQPLTGRTHQIRIHLSSVGCPIVGDHEYGGKDIFLSNIKRGYKLNRTMEEQPVNRGYLLHARGLSFTLPDKEAPEMFVAPLPKKMEVALKILRKYGVR